MTLVMTVLSCLPFLSCRQIVGIESRQVRDGGGPLVCGLPASGTPACEQCVAQKCCAEAQMCAETVGCPDTEACIRGCAYGDSACIGACGSKDQLAFFSWLGGVESCRIFTSCAQDCAPPDPWSCLGKVKWQQPNPATRSVVLRVRAVDLNEQPIAGATLSLCGGLDSSCGNPIVSQTTDADGRVSLSLAPVGSALVLLGHLEGMTESLQTIVTPPLNFDTDAGVLFTSPEVWDLVLAAAGVVRDPTRATVTLNVGDCTGFGVLSGGSGSVTFTVGGRDQDTKFAVFGEVTDTNPLGIYPTTTTEAPGGSLLVMNLPVNPNPLLAPRIEARVTGTNALIAAAQIAVRPGAISTMTLNPAP